MIESLTAFILFAFFMLGTPGPANMLMMLNSSQHGLLSSIRFDLGLICGKVILNVLMGLGVGILFKDSKIFQVALLCFSAGFMIYVTIRSWPTIGQRSKNKMSLTFSSGLMVQPLMNPKAWVMSAVVWANYAPDFGALPQRMLIVVFGFAAVGFICHTTWGIMGAMLHKTASQSAMMSRILLLLTLAVVLLIVADSLFRALSS